MIAVFTLPRLQVQADQNTAFTTSLLSLLSSNLHIFMAAISTSSSDHNAQEKLLKQ